MTMREVSASEFKAKCLKMLDELDDEGIVLTKHGKRIARVVPLRQDPRDFIGGRPDMMVNPDDDYFSTGLVWEAELPLDWHDRANFIVERKAMRHPAGR
jgi:prevent-host-death family protein